MCSCVLERARAHSSERCGNSKKASAAVGMLVRLVDITRVSHRRSPRRLPAPTSIHRYYGKHVYESIIFACIFVTFP